MTELIEIGKQVLNGGGMCGGGGGAGDSGANSGGFGGVGCIIIHEYK
jgi:hypothetical protein